MSSVRCLAFAVLLLLAGCVGLLADGDPIEPAGDHRPWTATIGDPWILETDGCGFCSGNQTVPEHEALVVYTTGHVLWFRFGAGMGPDGVTTAAGLSKYRDEVVRIVGASEAYRLAVGDGITVHEAATSRLVGDEWTAIQDRLDAAIQEAEDPGEPDWDCVDCSGPHVELLGSKRLAATLHNSDNPEFGNMEEGDPWDRILDQLVPIEDWVAAWAEP